MVLGLALVWVYQKFIYPTNNRFYTYYSYTLTTPIIFGLLNIISLIIAEYFDLSLRLRCLVMPVIMTILIIIYQLIFNRYNFKHNSEFIKYFLGMFINYFILWNLVIYTLEKYI